MKVNQASSNTNINIIVKNQKTRELAISSQELYFLLLSLADTSNGLHLSNTFLCCD